MLCWWRWLLRAVVMGGIETLYSMYCTVVVVVVVVR